MAVIFRKDDSARTAGQRYVPDDEGGKRSLLKGLLGAGMIYGIITG